MEEKPFFEIKGWFDILTYLSVVPLPIYFILSFLCSSQANENRKEALVIIFLILYTILYASKNETSLRMFPSVVFWLLGAVSIYFVFPLWTYAIYLFFPVAWVIREIWREKHER